MCLVGYWSQASNAPVVFASLENESYDNIN